MKKNKKILIIATFLFISLINSDKIYALNADRVIELRESGQTVAADNANPIKKTSVVNSNVSSVNTSASNNKKGDGFLTPPIGNGTDSGTDLRTIFMNILDIAQTIMIMAATLYLLYAGFMFVTAKGDPAKLKKAKDALLWGLVGTALVLTAEVLALGIGDTVKEVFKGN